MGIVKKESKDEIVKLMLQEVPTEEIARRLNYSVSTIRKVFEELRDEYGVNSKMGIAVAYKKGYEVIIISGENSPAIDFLLSKFPPLKAHQNIRNKKELVEKILSEKNLTFENVLYLGDDINDMECLNAAKIKYTVENANYKVKELNIPVLKHKGGYGAFREAVDALP